MSRFSAGSLILMVNVLIFLYKCYNISLLFNFIKNVLDAEEFDYKGVEKYLER